jgi:hypothetical protein
MNQNVTYSPDAQSANDISLNENETYTCWENWAVLGQCGSDYQPSGTLSITNTATGQVVTINTSNAWGNDVEVLDNGEPQCGCNLRKVLP